MSEVGRPGIPTRVLVGLHYLKHAYGESDESVVARWVESPLAVVREAKKAGVKLRQSYARVGKKALFKQQGYARARQGKRADKENKEAAQLSGARVA